jgi:hypothetical protein
VSWLGDAFSYFRRLTLLDNEVARLVRVTDAMNAQITDHDRRLIRIETLIEFGRPSGSPRLPRR